MALKYVTYQDLRKGSNRLFYGRAVHLATKGVDDIAQIIEQRTSITHADVIAVLREFCDELPRYLKDSKKVHLPNLGTFYLSISSKGSIVKDEWSPTVHVKGIRCKFLAEGHKNNGKVTRAFTGGLKFEKAVNHVK